MAFRTAGNDQLMLMRQIVAHEDCAKKNFDYFTGQNASQKFYQGRLQEIVDKKASTWLKDQSELQKFRFGYKQDQQAEKKGENGNDVGAASEVRSRASRMSHRSCADTKSHVSARPIPKLHQLITPDPRQLLPNDWTSYNLDTRTKDEIIQQEKAEAELRAARRAMFDTQSKSSRAASTHIRYPSPEMLAGLGQYKHITVHGRKNIKVEPYTEFKVDKFSRVFNADRMAGVTAKDAMIDPHQTMAAPQKPKDVGYQELNKRSTEHHDMRAKVIQDYNGNPIIKVDSLHGQKNGLLWGQTTHSNLCGFDRPNMRQTFGKDSPSATLKAMQRFGRIGNDIVTPRKSGSVRSSVAPSLVQERANDFPAGDFSNNNQQTESEKQMLAKKLYLMRKMLKNEKRANEIISDRLNGITHEAHGSSQTVNIIGDSMRTTENDRGVLKQPLGQQ